MAIKIKDIDDLLGSLDEDVKWRKKEIADMYATTKIENSPDYLLRAGFVMLCAHFEGFIKFASNAYISYISSKKIKNVELKPSFSAIMLQQQSHSLFNSGGSGKVKTSVVKQLVDIHGTLLEKEFFIKIADDNPPIHTDSNPNSKVLKEITTILNLDYCELFQQRAAFIDGEILCPRNHIAHGIKRPLSRDDYKAVHDYVLAIIDKYKEVIIEEAISESFLNSSFTMSNSISAIIDFTEEELEIDNRELALSGQT